MRKSEHALRRETADHAKERARLVMGMPAALEQAIVVVPDVNVRECPPG
jgi:hypothetical protein